DHELGRQRHRRRSRRRSGDTARPFGRGRLRHRSLRYRTRGPTRATGTRARTFLYHQTSRTRHWVRALHDLRDCPKTPRNARDPRCAERRCPDGDPHTQELSGGSMRRNKERILVVDDEPQVLVALEDLLSDDFSIVTTSSATEALEVIRSAPDIAVVVTDQRMPHMTGDRLLAHAERASKALGIMITGFADLN